MPNFTVKYETRQQGAIGIFEIRQHTVLADSPERALEPARTRFNEDGYETRFPQGVWDESGNRVL